ncbi:MAG: hypothetical protein LUD81_02480 [Clostridiales bacterium]|nr:hypothetical protein [Clostridiales bacterium]
MKDKPMYVCPVCGYNGLYESAYSHYADGSYAPPDELCPCCRFQFGLDDFDFDNSDWYNPREKAFETWRKEWIKDGMKFWFKEKQPKDYNPEKQLKELAEKPIN